MPQFINVTDAIITSSNPQQVPDHQNVLSISTAGSNRYLFEFQNTNVLRRWSAAFRIAIYERVALQECYTAALIARSRTAPNVRRLFAAYHGALGSKGKYSGWVRVRFSWNLKWQKCWAVVSDTPSSWFAGNGAIHERLLYKFSSKQSLRGEVRFYESRRDAKNKPIAILSNVFAAFAVYPEKSFLVDASTMIKVEGSLITGKSKLWRAGEQYKDGFILLMPDDLPTSTSNTSSPAGSPVIGASASGTFGGSSGSGSSRSRFSTSPSSFFSALSGSSPHKGVSSAAFESMLTWLVAFYDAFNLYGRPEKLITDASKPESMIFAMPHVLEDSYLDVEEVFMTLAEQGQLESNKYSAREWRLKLKEMTLATLKEGKKVFNPAILLQNTLSAVPVIREPVPPVLRQKAVPLPPIPQESPPTVNFSEHVVEMDPPPYPEPTAQRSRLGFLRRKPSHPEADRHSRSLSESGVENTRAAMNRFSLAEDSSEDENAPNLFQNPTARSSYQASPLRNSEVRPSTADSNEELFVRPTLLKRKSTHRRGHSESRMNELYREAAENKRGYASDEESISRPPTARRVSSDELLKAHSGPFLGADRRTGRSRESFETGTQFNRTFDENPQPERDARFRLSESSSDRSETPADPADTPRMEATNLQSSPASSMESLPTVKVQSSPLRDRDERMYNAPVAPQDSFHAPIFRDSSQPSVLMPVNGQPIPVRRDPSPNRVTYAQGPRSAPWSSVNPQAGPANGGVDSARRTHAGHPIQAGTGYPVQPAAPPPHPFSNVPDDRTANPHSIQSLPMRARGPLSHDPQSYSALSGPYPPPPPKQSGPYPPPPQPQPGAYPPPPQQRSGAYPLPPQQRYHDAPPDHKIPRRKVQGPVPTPVAAAAARSAYPPASRPSRSVSPPNKLRKGYPGQQPGLTPTSYMM